jgi:hypothetical protein
MYKLHENLRGPVKIVMASEARNNQAKFHTIFGMIMVVVSEPKYTQRDLAILQRIRRKY